MLEMENSKKDNSSEEKKEINILLGQLQQAETLEVESIDSDCSLIETIAKKLENYKNLIDLFSYLKDLNSRLHRENAELKDSLKSKDGLKVSIESLKEENRQLKENTKKLTHEKNKVEYENRRIKNRLSNYVSEDELAKMSEDEFYLQPANDKSEEIKEIETLIEIVNGNIKRMVGNAAEPIYVSYETHESILEKLVDYKNLFYAHSDLKAENIELKKEIEDLKFKLIIKSTNANERDEELSDENDKLKKENFTLKVEKQNLLALNGNLETVNDELEKENDGLKQEYKELLEENEQLKKENNDGKVSIIESEELIFLQNKNRELQENFRLLKRLIYTFDKDVK
ncbi:MAG: hypothetical protein ABF289_18435 [Clostridiales bacterium]